MRMEEQDDCVSYWCAYFFLLSLSSSFNWGVTTVNWTQRNPNEGQT